MSRKIPVAIIMGSDSDLPKMAGAVEVLEEFGVPYHIEVVSAHRTPHRMIEFADQAAENGYEVIIAGAGGAAHLPGMVASATSLPVIGVPVEVGSMQGLDALLSIVQMPRGVPVATMAVDNSANAGLFAVRILALRSAKLRERLIDFNKSQKSKVKQANQKLKQKLENLLNKS